MGRCCSQPSQSSALENPILWMAVRGEELPNLLATTYAEAARLAGKHCWGLVLSSSARVILITYQTVVGVRYPELVLLVLTPAFRLGFTQAAPSKRKCLVLTPRTLDGSFLRERHSVVVSSQCFGTFLQHACMQLGDIGSVVDWLCSLHRFSADARSNLAVLHNQNKMVNHFHASS